METASSSFVSVTPLIPAGAVLADELRYYVEVLGFEVVWEGAGMAGVARGSVKFNLMQNTNKVWADNTSASIGVKGLDELHAEYKAAGASVGALEIKHWGRREFHLVVPSGVCYQFYEE